MMAMMSNWKHLFPRNHAGATYVAGHGENYWGSIAWFECHYGEMKSDDLVFLIMRTVLFIVCYWKAQQTTLFKNGFGPNVIRRKVDGLLTLRRDLVAKRTRSHTIGLINQDKQLGNSGRCFGRISVFLKLLLRNTFWRKIFKHYWVYSVFKASDSLTPGLFGSPPEQWRRIDLRLQVRFQFISFRDCISEEKVTNFNVKLRSKFVTKYFWHRSCKESISLLLLYPYAKVFERLIARLPLAFLKHVLSIRGC